MALNTSKCNHLTPLGSKGLRETSVGGLTFSGRWSSGVAHGGDDKCNQVLTTWSKRSASNVLWPGGLNRRQAVIFRRFFSRHYRRVNGPHGCSCTSFLGCLCCLLYRGWSSNRQRRLSVGCGRRSLSAIPAAIVTVCYCVRIAPTAAAAAAAAFR